MLRLSVDWIFLGLMLNNSLKKSVRNLLVLVRPLNKEFLNFRGSSSKKSRKYSSWSIKSKRNISLTDNSTRSNSMRKCKRKSKPKKIKMVLSLKIQMKIKKKLNKLKSKKLKLSPKRYLLSRRNQKTDLVSKSEVIPKMMNDKKIN